MKIDETVSTQQILIELGARIKKQRIELGLTQNELAAKSGIHVRTLSNLENGSDVTLSVLLNVLRAEMAINSVDALLPEQIIRPTSYLNKETVAYRVRNKKKKTEKQWKWGDEQ